MDASHYAGLNPRDLKARMAVAPIAYLPLGTLEWHGEHLPLGSDGLQSQGFFTELARRVGGVVLPMLFLGPDLVLKKQEVDYYGMDVFGFSREEPNQLAGSVYWVEDDLFHHMLEAILGNLKRAGFQVVVAHGHGPSTGHFNKAKDDWEDQFGMKLFSCWGSSHDKEGLGMMTDHAAANETSLMMALHPDLVQMDNLDPNPDVWPVAVSGGDPRSEASRDRGERALSLQVEYMSGILTAALDGLSTQ